MVGPGIPRTLEHRHGRGRGAGIGGRVLPSVTLIISQVGKHWLNFDAIPPEVLERACTRGTDFHRLAALHARSLWVDEIPESCEGFFRSFVGWYANFVKEAILVEHTFVHPTLGFTGTPDAIVRVKGDEGLTLLDWKTPAALSKSWRLQVAAYSYLAEVNGYPISRVATLQPRSDGGRAKFQGYTKSLTPDYAIFLSGLNVFKFFEGGN